MTFNPERFLGTDDREPEMDPHNLSFGFGRRICPGRDLADATMFLMIAQSLAMFNIGKPTVNGKIIEPVVEFTPGTLSHPVEFRAEVKPRSARAEALIRSVEEEHPFTTSDAEAILKVKT